MRRSVNREDRIVEPDERALLTAPKRNSQYSAMLSDLLSRFSISRRDDQSKKLSSVNPAGNLLWFLELKNEQRVV